MADPKQSENPRTQTLLRLNLDLWREAIRMAKLLLREGEPLNWEEREARERYYSFVPMIAGKLSDDLHGFSGYLDQASEKELVSRFEQIAAVVKELRAINDEVESREKA